MTFLELAKKLRQKVGGVGTGPVSVIGQAGEDKDYVDWINEAWLLIQAEETCWKWMRKDVSFQTTIGKSAYLATAASGETGVADLAAWREDEATAWRCYRTSLGRLDEGYLVHWPYQDFRGVFDFGTQSLQQSKPSVFSIRDRDNALLLGHTPDAVYTITGEYQAAPSELAEDDDVPGMPARFHMAIVYRAMQLYAYYEAAPEVMAEGKDEYEKLIAALRIDQLDQLTFGPPLA